MDVISSCCCRLLIAPCGDFWVLYLSSEVRLGGRVDLVFLFGIFFFCSMLLDVYCRLVVLLLSFRAGFV